jgi:hypothetical protein
MQDLPGMSSLGKLQKAISNRSQAKSVSTLNHFQINAQNKKHSFLSTSKYPKLTISFSFDKFPREKMTITTFFRDAHHTYCTET